MFQKVSQPLKCHYIYMHTYCMYIDTNTDHITPTRTCTCGGNKAGKENRKLAPCFYSDLLAINTY